MKKCLFVLVLALIGCGDIVENPTTADIGGRWEALGSYHSFLYAAIELHDSGGGRAVILNSDREINAASLSNFTSYDNYFTIDLLSDDDPQPEIWEGSVSESQLCFKEQKENAFFKDIVVCFSRMNQIEQYRQVTLGSL